MAPVRSVIAELRERVAQGRLIADPEQERAAELLTLLARRLDGWKPGKRALRLGRAQPEPQGLYLYGGVGRGKSMLMDLFFEAAPLERKRRVHFHEFMLEVHARIAERRAKKEGDPLPQIARAAASKTWLLCFDEMQVTDIADAMILARLFEHLFARGVIVVATSNRPPDDLYKDGLNRQLFTPFIAMLKEHLEMHELDGGRDHRLARLEAAGVWASPLGPEADRFIDAAWSRITCGARERSETLSVQGRELVAARAAAGAARFTFAELCAQPLGAADYLALARRYHTLVVEGAPRLTPQQRNEAKRFVTLVDALYETRTKLVVSAQAEPHALYAEGDGAFEFARTASRLIEMRSRDYLAAERVLADTAA